MKLHLFLLPLLLLAQNTFPNQPPKKELKIYRAPIDYSAALCFIFGTISLIGSGTFFLVSSDQKTPPGASFLFGVLPAFLGIKLFVAGRKAQQKWNALMHKPILIFDEEGFTYEQSMEVFKDRKNVRYLWKDVISHWVSRVVDQYGNTSREYWHYHIEGVDDIVSINVAELNIPKNLRAQVHSLRQGQIRALSI